MKTNFRAVAFLKQFKRDSPHALAHTQDDKIKKVQETWKFQSKPGIDRFYNPTKYHESISNISNDAPETKC